MPADKHKSSPLVWPCWPLIMFLEAKSWHGGGVEYLSSTYFGIHFEVSFSLGLSFDHKGLAPSLYHKSSPPWFSSWALSWIQGGISLFSFLQQHGRRSYAVFSSQSFLHCDRYKSQGISPSTHLPPYGFHQTISCLSHVSHQELSDTIRVKTQASKTQ